MHFLNYSTMEFLFHFYLIYSPDYYPVHRFTQLTHILSEFFRPDHIPVHRFTQHPDNDGDLFSPDHYPVYRFTQLTHSCRHFFKDPIIILFIASYS